MFDPNSLINFSDNWNFDNPDFDDTDLLDSAINFKKALYKVHYECFDKCLYSEETLKNVINYYIEKYDKEFDNDDLLEQVISISINEFADCDYSDPSNYTVTYFLNGIFVNGSIYWLSKEDLIQMAKNHNILGDTKTIINKLMKLQDEIIKNLLDKKFQIKIRGFDHLEPLLSNIINKLNPSETK